MSNRPLTEFRMRDRITATRHPHGFTHRGIASFANSLTFNPDEFFQIDTPGVTVNSVGSDWLVDNRLASTLAVPEPSGLLLFSTGALALAGIGRWRGRRAVPHSR